MRSRIFRVKAGAHQHLLAVERPAFHEHTIAMLTPDFIGEMVRDRELHEVAGNAFMSKDRSRVLDRRADIEILRLRVVARDEIEAVILIVNTGGLISHGAGWLKRFGSCRLEDGKITGC